MIFSLSTQLWPQPCPTRISITSYSNTFPTSPSPVPLHHRKSCLDLHLPPSRRQIQRIWCSNSTQRDNSALLTSLRRSSTSCSQVAQSSPLMRATQSKG